MEFKASGGSDPRDRFHADFAFAKANIPIAEVLEHYGHKFNKAGRMACPFHGGDNETALSLDADRNRIRCFTHCQSMDVIDVEQKLGNLLQPIDALRSLHSRYAALAWPNGVAEKASEAPRKRAPRKVWASVEAAAESLSRAIGARCVGTYYYGLDPGPEMVILRFDHGPGPDPLSGGKGGKEFRTLGKVPGGWSLGEPDWPGGKRPLFGLQDLLGHPEDHKVLIVEGEKCCEVLRQALEQAGIHDVAVVTSSFGADHVGRTDWTPLAGRPAFVLPDCDAQGERHLGLVAAALPGVRVIRLPGLGPKEDIVDWLAAGHPVADVFLPEYRHAPELRNSGTPGETDAEKRARYGMVNALDITPRRIDWLAYGVLARRKLTLLSGRGSTGKSQVGTSYVASITTGSPLPDGSTPACIGRVLILAAEDDKEDTVVVRLMAAGADLSRVEILTARETVKTVGDDGKERKTIHPRCIADIGYWQRLLTDWPDTVLIVFDTLPSYMGKGVDDHKNISVKNALEPFIEQVLAVHGIACLGIVHVGKGIKEKSVDKILGSVAYGNTARVCWTTVEDPRRPGCFLMAWMKANNTEKQGARPFVIEKTDVVHNSEVIPTSKVVWAADAIDQSADEILAAACKDEQEKTAGRRGFAPVKKDLAKDFILDQLRGGPKAYAAMAKTWELTGGKLGTLNNAATELVGDGLVRTTGKDLGNIFTLVVPEPPPTGPTVAPDEGPVRDVEPEDEVEEEGDVLPEESSPWDTWDKEDDEGEEWKRT